MNKEGIFIVLMSVSPLVSYFLGRLNRSAGLVCGTGVLGVSAVVLGLKGFDSPPFMASIFWALGALGHSAVLNASSSQSAPEEKKLAESKAEADKLEAEVAALKKDFADLAASEKKSLVLYSAVKLLSEAVELEGAGKQFGRYVKDYFDTGDFAFYVSDPNSGAPWLFSLGDRPALGSWAGLTRYVGNAPALDAPLLLEAEGFIFMPVRHAGEMAGFFVFGPGIAAAALRKIQAQAENFAEEISFAVKRIQLFRQVEWLSMVDGLTGVYRRNALDEKIGEELRRASAFKTTLGFMIVDIDHFKKLNDRYGHQFGDMVLKRVGHLLRTSVYETDFVGRYGGEEFGIVLPRADFAGVLRKAESIRSRIEAENFAQGLETVKITVSIGIAHFPRDARTSQEIIAKADAALYRAKETGRNRVVDAGGV